MTNINRFSFVFILLHWTSRSRAGPEMLSELDPPLGEAWTLWSSACWGRQFSLMRLLITQHGLIRPAHGADKLLWQFLSSLKLPHVTNPQLIKTDLFIVSPVIPRPGVRCTWSVSCCDADLCQHAAVGVDTVSLQLRCGALSSHGSPSTSMQQPQQSPTNCRSGNFSLASHHWMLT